MIPAWQQVLAEAAAHLAQGGQLHIVDFGRMEQLPGVFKMVLAKWLGWFGVYPRAGLPAAARQRADAQGLTMSEHGLYHGYALHIVLRRPTAALPQAI